MIPNYRINYRDCSESKTHEGEKLNFVCLNEQCHDSSLICSICREDKHKGHTVKPLKHYIESLRALYSEAAKDYTREIELLEESRYAFLANLRQTVERVAEEFMKLEESAIKRFNQLRDQILNNQSKQNKFQEFYKSLVHNNGDRPQFLIQNYLPSKQISGIANPDQIQQLATQLVAQITKTSETMFEEAVQKVEQVVGLKLEQKLANTIKKINNQYMQTNFSVVAQNLSCFAVDLVKNFTKAKLKIKIKKMKKATIWFGAIEKQLFKTLNHKMPALGPTYSGRVFCFNSSGHIFGQEASTLMGFGQNSNLEMSVVGNSLKVNLKKNSASFNLPVNFEFYFFFALQGQAEVQIVPTSGN